MSPRRKPKPNEQLSFPFGPLHNKDLFSNHWLENRLLLEPEWEELKEQAKDALEKIIYLWSKEQKNVDKYVEPSLEYAFIQPIFEILGWNIVYQTWVRGRKPDYALFINEESKDRSIQAGHNSPEFWKHPVVLADAKAWDVKLDRPTYVNNKREYPPEQIEWYLNNSLLDYAILTNGMLWRLIPREHAFDQPRFQTYLQFDLPAFLGAWEQENGLFQFDNPAFEDFFRFFLFFSPLAHKSVESRTPLIERARKGSSEYRLGIGQDLKTRVFDALRLSIEGFLKFESNELKPKEQLSICREQSFILLYRLLFIMYAEDRHLLPYRVNRLYTENRSLGRYRDEIASHLDRCEQGREPDYSKNSTAIWDDLTLLFDLIDNGRKNYSVPAYNGGLFNPEDNVFLTEKKISDWYLSRVIDQLGRARDEKHPETGLYRVDYRDLQIQHLGNIYEGLLELHPHIAEENLVVVRRKSTFAEKTIKEGGKIPKGCEKTDIRYEPGDIHLLTNKGERRASGSYYTPNNIVKYLVERTLGPLCRQINKGLGEEIRRVEELIAEAGSGELAPLETQLEQLKTEYDDRVLRLRVLDPAMGSGHFLLRACQYLAEEIATHPYTGDSDIDDSLADEPAITVWKRRIVEHCLYGVDKNLLAVELAKLALWLETVSSDQPLTFIDHHFRHGNSLVGGKIASLATLPGSGEMFEEIFAKQLEEKLPAILEPLAAIRQMPSDTTSQVKAKEKLYKQTLKNIREPFKNVADLWCATYYLEKEQQPDTEKYQKAISLLNKPRKSKTIAQEPWFLIGLDRAKEPDTVFFHWELEFPEVFFAETGRRQNQGFNAVIGNPPYDVLSEKELGYDISDFKSFIESQEMYNPSRRGKNNLYKLFICRALDLLAEGGRLGFIVPMPLLGDDQAAGIRRKFIRSASLTSIEAFPQKDNPNLRVFREAKLSTTAFVLMKTSDEHLKGLPFVSRIHPANRIEPSSPVLRLKTSEIPLYDESNLSIVSCSQEDWDLAVKIMQTGRLGRLGKYCKQFQGEVNETNEGTKGNISDNQEDGPLILRGSNVCLYQIRKASQGESKYLEKEKYLNEKSLKSKAYHSQQLRVGFQRSSPQNNFRRIIATLIEPDNFCFDTISYVPKDHSKLPLEFILGLLNSKLLDWYFRLGSTNSKVNEYQFVNLPCPVFQNKMKKDDETIKEKALEGLNGGDFEKVFELLSPLLKDGPFSLAVRDMVCEAVKCIIKIEHKRGEISRRERSHLDSAAEPYQNFIDILIYAMAGLSESDISGLEERLLKML